MFNEINFCTEHAGRTCCDMNNTNRIKAKIAYSKTKSEVSDTCFLMTAKALCSHCDGDIVNQTFYIYRELVEPKVCVPPFVISGIKLVKVITLTLI